MYTVSSGYLTAIKRPAIRSRVTGTIADQPFTDDNILDGSFTITNQNSGNDNVQIGTVYIGELSITLRGLEVERYTLDGVTITPYFELLLPDGVTWESVPLGKYYVGEANYTAAGIVIKAYDAMSKLDKTFTGGASSGTPYQLAKFACEACFLELATDQADFNGFANGSEALSYWQEGTDVKTWRDFISWVAQACGCYVTADRFGRIVFRAYTQNVVDTVDITGRFKGASYSDYETRYTGLYCTNIEDSTMDYYGLPQDDGLTYSLGQNPFLQFGTAEGKEIIRRAILNKLAYIQYVPFSVTLPENPAYDLGDVLSLPGGLGDGAKLFCVNKYTWTYHRGIKLEGVGKNPALASAQSKTDKNIAGLVSKMNEDRMQYYDLINSDSIVINSGETKEIFKIRYVTKKDTHIDFHAELRATINTLEEISGDNYTEHDVTGTVTYYLNDDPIAYSPILTEMDGIQLRHLLYFWQSEANVIGIFRAKLTVSGGSLTIPTGNLHAYLAGEGLVGEVPNTDTEVTDTVQPLDFNSFGTITDAVEIETETPTSGAFTDTLSALNFSTVLSLNFTEAISTLSGIIVTTYLTDCLDEVTVPTVNHRWVADADGQYIETVDITGVTGFTALNGGAVSYLCSFDSGQTWQGWNGTDWEDDLQMTYNTLSTLTATEFGSGAVRFRVIFDSGESISGFTAIGGHI